MSFASSSFAFAQIALKAKGNNINKQDQDTQYNKNEDSKPTTSSESISKFNNNSDFDMMYLLMWGFVIASCCWFFYTKAKNSMLEISGEHLQIDLSEEPKKSKKINKKNKAKEIARTIKSLDKKYPKSNTNIYEKPYTTTKKIEQDNIVDLDELFNKQKEKENSYKNEINNEENEALEAFLSGFSFDDFIYEDTTEIEKVEKKIDNELFEKIINNDSMRFTTEDLKCIKDLMSSEINDETLHNIDKYAVSNPITKPSRKEVLENLITTYAISQDIKFTTEDVDTLKKLINIELDTTFTKDLSVQGVDINKYEKQI